jgi:hypothetical protein
LFAWPLDHLKAHWHWRTGMRCVSCVVCRVLCIVACGGVKCPNHTVQHTTPPHATIHNTRHTTHDTQRIPVLQCQCAFKWSSGQANKQSSHKTQHTNDTTQHTAHHNQGARTASACGLAFKWSRHATQHATESAAPVPVVFLTTILGRCV